MTVHTLLLVTNQLLEIAFFFKITWKSLVKVFNTQQEKVISAF